MRPSTLLRIAPLLGAAVTSAAPVLVGAGTLDLPGGDLSGLSYPLENGLPANVFGGIGSGLAWAGGNRFLAIPDRGPNATAWAGGDAVDNTASFIPRVHQLRIDLAPSTGALPFSVTPVLEATTLLWSATPLVYGSTPGIPSAVPPVNDSARSYFTGRSDNFGPGLSGNPDFARRDPEGVRLSRDGRSVFVSDEYGPYVEQFDRASGRRLRTFALPDHFQIANLSSLGASEISGNTSGRVANKGMEGLAITPDGRTLVGFVQSPLIQDGGDGGRANRIVTIDIATGATREYAYDNYLATTKKAYNSSELLALNDHQFLVLERDGKGLGDGSKAVVKQIWAVDIAGATDVSGLSGEAALLAAAPAKTLFLDVFAALKAAGFKDTEIPAKLEGIAFGEDIQWNGATFHTLYMGNDNDFVPDVAGPNRVFVFAFSDADVAALGLSPLRRQVFNVPPTVDAGPSVFLHSVDVPAASLAGTVSDADGDPLSCRWSEGSTTLSDWAPASAGTCPLPLAGLGLGSHVLVLQATDSKDTAADTTTVVVENSAPTVSASGGGIVQPGDAVVLHAVVSDFDGDLLRWNWSVGGTVRCQGDATATPGGTPVSLADCTLGKFRRGTLQAVLSVADGVNAPVTDTQLVRILDTIAPSLSPVAVPSILWPADGRWVEVEIHTHVHDQSRFVRLSAEVSENFPDLHGKDWTRPSVDPWTGVVRLRLRAEPGPKGQERIYTVALTAADRAGNTSRAGVAIRVPARLERR